MTVNQMSMREILDNGFKLLKDNWKSYLGVAALGIFTILGFGFVVQVSYYLFGKKIAMLCGIAFFFLAFAGKIAMNSAIIKMASEQILERKISCMEAYLFGFSKVWYIFLGTLLYAIIICLGAIVLILPGVYLGNGLAFFAHSIIIEDESPWRALKRSKVMTKCCWWRCFVILLFITLLVLIISIPPRLAIETLGALITGLSGSEFIISFTNNMIGFCAASLFEPLFFILMTLLYYDLKIVSSRIER